VTQESVEIKLEPAIADQPTLKHEAQVCKDMTGVVGFSFMHWFGTEKEYNILVTSSLGPTLESLFQICKGKFSLKTILLLSDQIISRLEDLHAEDYVYGKIAPENLRMGREKFGAQVSVANLGYAKKHVPYSQGNSTSVTHRYASINMHKGIPKSYCDDFESWWYVMRHFCGGSLPWEGYTCSELILEKKSNMTPEELFRGFPPEFATSLGYVKSLALGEKPDYKLLRTTFQDLFARLSFERDYCFDWTIYKYYLDRAAFVQYGEGELLAQLKTPYMTAQEMEDEVNSKWHSLRHDIEVEAKFCTEILYRLSDAERTCEKLREEQSSRTELTNEQSQALISAHCKVLDECCDFFFATWHPSSSERLHCLVKPKRVPSRMWHNGIFSLLELLRRRSVYHFLAFLRLAYSMVALIRECVPSNEDYPWTEVLGDLGRCYWGVSGGDADAGKLWAGVAGTWYNKVADENPHDGRPQHHLGVIARPRILQQLFHYSKALVSVTPFRNTWPTLMALFELFPEGSELACQKYPLVESMLVKAHSALFKHGSIPRYESLMGQFRSSLHDDTGRLRKEFREQSSEIAFILCATACGVEGSPTYNDQKFHNSIILHARQALGETVSVVCADGEKVLPFMHVILVYLHGSAFVPSTVSHAESCMPWDEISRFVNTLRRYVVVGSQSEAMEFPQQQTVAGRQLPEDFHLRGSTLAQNYFPLHFFDDLNPSTKKRMEERPGYVVYRAKRIWYLAYKLALVSWTPLHNLLPHLLIIRRPIYIWSTIT
jgi:casein kinase I homolog HRR25